MTLNLINVHLVRPKSWNYIMSSDFKLDEIQKTIMEMDFPKKINGCRLARFWNSENNNGCGFPLKK